MGFWRRLLARIHAALDGHELRMRTSQQRQDQQTESLDALEQERKDREGSG